jgi:hypothetical protein
MTIDLARRNYPQITQITQKNTKADPLDHDALLVVLLLRFATLANGLTLLYCFVFFVCVICG